MAGGAGSSSRNNPWVLEEPEETHLPGHKATAAADHKRTRCWLGRPFLYPF
ncbi:hypothetical protein XELAEV_18044200mg [Xenopus laevis]|uniref:Uncharacterized protein n=1 Tax=Xenopus laevis TaxID=8355 RepID=A0A974BY30_XENLA|nr:hypothetical protein XELAEV_18044200mg [Xenopus laevis]